MSVFNNNGCTSGGFNGTRTVEMTGRAHSTGVEVEVEVDRVGVEVGEVLSYCSARYQEIAGRWRLITLLPGNNGPTYQYNTHEGGEDDVTP